LENAKKAIEGFEKEYQWDIEDIRKQEKKKRTFRREELLRRFMAKKLFGWSDKRYNEEYWVRLEWNWKWLKGGKRKRTLETIKEKEETE